MGFNSPENKERKLTHAHSPPKSLSEAIKKISETFSSPAMLNMSKTSIQEVDEDITEKAVSDDTKIDASDPGAIGDISSEIAPLKKSKSFDVPSSCQAVWTHCPAYDPSCLACVQSLI